MKIQKQLIAAIAVLILGSIFLSEVSLMLLDQPIEETFEEREEKRDSLEKEEDLNNTRKLVDDACKDFISNEEFANLNCNRGINSILIESSHSNFSQTEPPLFITHCSLKIDFC